MSQSDKIIINNYTYCYYKPVNYTSLKLLIKQIKRVKEKIKASIEGCYKDKLTKTGKPYYTDYPALLLFLENELSTYRNSQAGV